MADNPTWASDLISGTGYPRVKMTLGPDGTNTGDWAGRAIGSTGVAAWIDPRPDAAAQSQDSAGLTTSVTAYTAGDTLGNGWTFTSMTRDSAGSGEIRGARLLDIADITDTVDVYLFTGSVTFGTDNAAPSISDADLAKYVGKLTFGMEDFGGARAGVVDSLRLPYTCDATSLYAYAVTRVGHTFFGAVGDLKLRLHYVRD